VCVYATARDKAYLLCVLEFVEHCKQANMLYEQYNTTHVTSTAVHQQACRLCFVVLYHGY
jgi:hypothetical protein